MPLVILTPIALEIDHRDLTNRVGHGHVCTLLYPKFLDGITLPCLKHWMPAGPFRIVPHDRFFRVYEGDELLGTEVYLKGAQRIIQRFKELAPDAVIAPYQRPPRHADRVQEKRAGIYDTDRKGR